MNMKLREVVIVAYGRSALGRAFKGSLASEHPVDFAGQVLDGVLKKVPQIDRKTIDDVIIGCAKPEATQGMNIARLVSIRAGIPYDVPAQTINRFCSSGLQAIATGANSIIAGQAEIVLAGGVETMTQIPMGSDPKYRNQWLMENNDDVYMAMGLTAENVADRYNLSRESMDQMAVESHRKASMAQKENKFTDEIIDVVAYDGEGNEFIFNKDEGIRENTNLEKLATLKTIFKEGGKVTAGTSSQMTDGAAAVLLMSMDKAEELGIKPIAKFLGYKIAGLDPKVMGLGPIKAVPKVLKLTGLKMEDMDVIELNEAFAAQAIPCIEELGMDKSKVNPNGGALALGHPLGATGAILTCKAISELKRTNGRYGLITMCIGGGMGAAAIIEMI
jgi:acetyl-CoA acyltransferase